MAVLKNNATAVELLLKASADANYDAGKPLRIAVRHDHHEVVLALLKGGASINATRELHFTPQFIGTSKTWQTFLAKLVGHIKFAGLDETLPVFDELAEIAQEPACRRIVQELTEQYPRLLAKLL